MKKIFLTSIITIAMCMPALADPVTPNIAANAESAACTNTVLETTSGTSNLEANWNPNTLNLKWYDDVNGKEITPTNPAAATCTYDSGITVPLNSISKTGYTFAGWKVKVIATGFDLSTLDDSINGNKYGYASHDGKNNQNIEQYNLTIGSAEWAAEYSYGIIKGTSICSTQRPSIGWTKNNNIFTSDHFVQNLVDETGQEGAGNCWCQATGFDADKDGTYEGLTTLVWVFNQSFSSDSCMNICAFLCGSYVNAVPPFRTAVFNSAQ